MELISPLSYILGLLTTEPGSPCYYLETAAHAGIQFGAHSGLQVVVAIGDPNQSPGCCCNMSLSISSEQFVLDCYDLTLGSYDMVLAVQDLEALADLHALIEGVCNGDKGQH
jgi:hypothetical protein